MRVVRDAIERRGHVDVFDERARRHVQADRREVEEAADAGEHEAVRRALRLGGGHGDDRGANTVAPDDLLGAVDGVDAAAVRDAVRFS